MFFFMCYFIEIFFLVSSGLVSSLMSYHFMALISYLLTVIRLMILLLTLLFDPLKLGRSLMDSSVRISLKPHVLRVLSPGSVIFLPTSDGI